MTSLTNDEVMVQRFVLLTSIARSTQERLLFAVRQRPFIRHACNDRLGQARTRI